MTDILDFNFSRDESFIRKNSYNNHKRDQTVQSKHFFSNSYYLQSIFTSSEEKCYKFLQLDDIYSIIIKIQQSEKIMTVIFKLMKINQIVKIKTNYLKSYFAGQFMKNQNCLFHRKINPLNGQISLQFSLFNKDMNFQNRLLSLIQFIRNHPQKVVDFWKNVLKIIDGIYLIEQKTGCKDKINDIKILSSLSRKQKQYQTIFTIKPIIQNFCLPLTNQISSMRKYSVFQGPQPQATKINWQYRKNLQQIQRDKKLLLENNIRNIQNYQHIQFVNLINEKQKFQLLEKSKYIKKDDIIRIQDKHLGKLFLNHSGYQNQNVDVMIEKLGYIGRTHQFNFLNYYFIVKEQRKKILLKMALKKVTLKQYLAKNCLTMSFESKLKIFLQIFFAVQVLWQKFEIFTGFISLQQIDITKTFIIKLQNISKWQILNKQRNQLSEYDRYIAKTQTAIRLQNIFQGLFYQKQLYNIKPTQKIRMKSLVEFDKQTDFIKNSVDEKNTQAPLYGLPEILNPLSYCFKEYQKYENLQISSKSEQEKWQQVNKIKHKLRNGSFDLMLGILFKSLQVVNAMS